MTHPILNQYPCGCQVRQGENDAYISPCLMHEAAPDLLEACEAIVVAAEYGNLSPNNSAVDLCRAAIAKKAGAA